MSTRIKLILSVGIIAVMCVYADNIKCYFDTLHHRVDSALGIHEDEHKKGSK